jgi:hypothetical protein
MIVDPYLIWSTEHLAWWGPRQRGYARKVGEAGRYHAAEAFAICAKALMGTGHRMGIMPDLPVREADLDTVNGVFARTHPGVPMPWMGHRDE